MTLPFFILVSVVLLACVGYVLARMRVTQRADAAKVRMHSLPSYYASMAAMLTAGPALGVLLIWQLAQPMVIERSVLDNLGSQDNSALMISDIRRLVTGVERAVQDGALSPSQAQTLSATDLDLAERLNGVGIVLGGAITPQILDAAQRYRRANDTGRYAMAGVVLALSLAGLGLALVLARPDFRARNLTESVVMGGLIVAASLAVLTTLGIVVSMLFETLNFFALHSWRDFFLGSSWAPNFRGDSDLSILPLLWGTLYISLIALVVAVPIGLFTAIYLSEYAGSRLRAIAKPMIELLAGIPTIVYGLFALVTVGPLLVNLFGQGEEGLLGLTWMAGATSVLTAGLVMGIMLIPFVSSLSDDIINAVPQSLRDGALGLGATRSETVRNVVLPAALPGIVGAILLATSRAIGETMIVVLGAGAIAKISGNPFEAMTTITTRIVSQLTGDTDFASPETLVAFALGLTLFVLTLGLNVIALIVVRKYREQYE